MPETEVCPDGYALVDASEWPNADLNDNEDICAASRGGRTNYVDDVPLVSIP